MKCESCAVLLMRITKLRDRKDYYVRENKRLRAQVRNQRQKLNEWEKKHGNDV